VRIDPMSEALSIGLRGKSATRDAKYATYLYMLSLTSWTDETLRDRSSFSTRRFSVSAVTKQSEASVLPSPGTDAQLNARPNAQLFLRLTAVLGERRQPDLAEVGTADQQRGPGPAPGNGINWHPRLATK